MFDGLNKVEDLAKNIPGNDFIKMAKLAIELKKIIPTDKLHKK